MPKSLPSPETLHKLLRYNPETGVLFWKARTPDMFSSEQQPPEHACAVWNSKFAHKEALTSFSSGYKRGMILGRHYLAHRTAWAIYYGEWPHKTIDHINGNRSDNRIKNLRVVSNSINMRNTKRRSNNTSGVCGVSFREATNKWQAYIFAKGRQKHLGFFDDLNEAISARKAAEVEHDYHPNHGR